MREREREREKEKHEKADDITFGFFPAPIEHLSGEIHRDSSAKFSGPFLAVFNSFQFCQFWEGEGGFKGSSENLDGIV